MAGHGGRLTYQPQLDGLRALSVVLVLFGHAAVPFMHGADLGVEVFFVLSGMLITTLLLREQAETGNVALGRFYVRRARRLLPALVLVSAATVAVYGVVPNHAGHETLLGAGAALFYVAAVIRATTSHNLGFMGHTWSLSIEEWFYFVWPAALLFITSKVTSRLGIARAIGGLTVFASLYYLAASLVFHWNHYRIHNGPDGRAKDLLIGCALAGIIHARPDFGKAGAWLPWLAGLSGLVLCWWNFASNGSGGRYDVTVLGTALAGGVVVLYAFQRPAGFGSRALSARPLVWLGVRSYGIYLWHYPIVGMLGRLPWLPRFTVMTVATLAVAAASYRFVEEPIRRHGLRHFLGGVRHPRLLLAGA